MKTVCRAIPSLNSLLKSQLLILLLPLHLPSLSASSVQPPPASRPSVGRSPLVHMARRRDGGGWGSLEEDSRDETRLNVEGLPIINLRALIPPIIAITLDRFTMNRSERVRG